MSPTCHATSEVTQTRDGTATLAEREAPKFAFVYILVTQLCEQIDYIFDMVI